MTTTTPSAMAGTTADARATTRTGWTGWVAFAGVMMVILGGLNMIEGLVAIVNDQWVVWSNANALLLDLTAWGWVQLVIGALVLIAGVALFTGNVLARAVGAGVAGVSLVANFAFIPAYPLWSLTLIVLNALVIWALVVHGGEMRA